MMWDRENAKEYPDGLYTVTNIDVRRFAAGPETGQTFDRDWVGDVGSIEIILTGKGQHTLAEAAHIRISLRVRGDIVSRCLWRRHPRSKARPIRENAKESARTRRGYFNCSIRFIRACPVGICWPVRWVYFKHFLESRYRSLTHILTHNGTSYSGQNSVFENSTGVFQRKSEYFETFWKNFLPHRSKIFVYFMGFT